MRTEQSTNKHQSHNQNINPHQTYEQQKQIAILLEKSNNSRLIAFPSIPNKDGVCEWYKIGGNSAYYYKYIIVPRLGKKPPTIHPDTDLNYRFKDGVIFIHWKTSLINSLAKLNYHPKEESNLLIFDLKQVFTANQIKTFKQLEKSNQENSNKLFRPQNPNPAIYGIIIELSRTIPVKSLKIKAGLQDIYAPELNRSLISLRQTYHSYANGRLEKSLATAKLHHHIDSLNALLAILTDNSALDITTQTRISRLLGDLELTIERTLKNDPAK